MRVLAKWRTHCEGMMLRRLMILLRYCQVSLSSTMYMTFGLGFKTAFVIFENTHVHFTIGLEVTMQ